ncbi:hypothetical protein CF319_g8707 [Tilletia indica]|uniref:F-box domain-containing protein n=1 Tax=Tilletia indica TaxID=43049 RepID=A0A177TP38_9BASI|nr:hypothetical protein CF319_g8707 [Tilletia indica]KAE8258175.1 hypothetical protein A4X13_0g1859 [Tilletia indica]
MEQIIGVHVHDFRPTTKSSIRADKGPWNVGPLASPIHHQRYWRYHFGEGPQTIQHVRFLDTVSISRLPRLRTISLDLRPFSGECLAPSESSLHAHPANTTRLLMRLWAHCATIEELNVRMPADQELICLLERIIAMNTALRIVHIDVDSTVAPEQKRIPSMRLDNCITPTNTYVSLQKFIVRAPTCNFSFLAGPDTQSSFFRRLRGVKHLALVCCGFSATKPSVVWMHQLLHTTPHIELCEISTYVRDNHFPYYSITMEETINLPHLKELILEMPALDSYFFRRIQAPLLYAMRVASNLDSDQWPLCQPNQFPSLRCVHILCCGTSFRRLRTLGIPTHTYVHTRSQLHNSHIVHEEPFFVYLKNPRRATPLTPIRFTNLFLTPQPTTIALTHGARRIRATSAAPPLTSPHFDVMSDSEPESTMGLSLAKRIRLS